MSQRKVTSHKTDTQQIHDNTTSMASLDIEYKQIIIPPPHDHLQHFCSNPYYLLRTSVTIATVAGRRVEVERRKSVTAREMKEKKLFNRNRPSAGGGLTDKACPHEVGVGVGVSGGGWLRGEEERGIYTPTAEQTLNF